MLCQSISLTAPLSGKMEIIGAILLIHDKYESDEVVILTTTLCSLRAACTSEKAQ